MTENASVGFWSGIWRWFDPRHKQVGYLGFIANRIAGLGLTLYLFMHLLALGQLAIGPQAYNNFIHLAHNPYMISGEFLVIIAGLLHGLNGVRIGMNSFGVGNKQQKGILIGCVVLAVLVSAYFGLRMYGGA